MGSMSGFSIKEFFYYVSITNPIVTFGAYYNSSADSPVILQIREKKENSIRIKNGTNSSITEGYVLVTGF